MTRDPVIIQALEILGLVRRIIRSGTGAAQNLQTRKDMVMLLEVVESILLRVDDDRSRQISRFTETAVRRSRRQQRQNKIDKTDA